MPRSFIAGYPPREERTLPSTSSERLAVVVEAGGRRLRFLPVRGARGVEAAGEAQLARRAQQQADGEEEEVVGEADEQPGHRDADAASEGRERDLQPMEAAERRDEGEERRQQGDRGDDRRRARLVEPEVERAGGEETDGAAEEAFPARRGGGFRLRFAGIGRARAAPLPGDL